MEHGDTTHVDTAQPHSSSSSSAPSPSKDRSGGFWHGVREWVQVIVVALIISLPIRLFIAEPFVVNGASMDPTFSTGQFLIVDRLSYRFEEPARGDVIVFRYPNNPSTYYIKRIVGLPGETVSIRNGRVTIVNDEHPQGVELDESYIAPAHLSHESQTVTLSDTEYFVMGDNRAQSSDSRAWGALEKDLIIGRPFVRLLPITSLSVFPGEHHEQTINQ